MNTPTKEQIAAAKAWARESMTKDDALQLAWSEATPERILLAALEAAEHAAKGAQAKVKEWEDEAARQGGMHAGGFEYFTARVRNANEQAHNAIYVAQQLEKKLEAAEADSARLDWLNEHPESVPYLDDGLWRIPYEVSGAGGFGGGVGEMHHRTLRGVIDAARKEDRT